MNEKRERLVRQAHEDYRHPDTGERCPLWVLGLIYDAKVIQREWLYERQLQDIHHADRPRRSARALLSGLLRRLRLDRLV
jgi:hypothetical protein